MVAENRSINSLKIILCSLLILAVSGCTIRHINNYRDAVINSTHGAVDMLVMDQPVYKNAIANEKNKVTNALLYSTLKKMGVLRELEREIGGNFFIEESLPLGKLNQLCWTIKFLQYYKKDLSADSQADYKKVYIWIDSKQTTWLRKLNEAYGKDELGGDDCRK